MRRITVGCATIALGLGGSAAAFASSSPRAADSDQYTTTSVVTTTVTSASTVTTPAVTVQSTGTVTPATTDTSSGSPVTPSDTGGTSPSNSGSGTPGTPTPKSSAKPAAASGGATPAAAGDEAVLAHVIDFGKSSKQLHDQIASAVTGAGYQPKFLVQTAARFKSFIAGPLATLLSADGTGPVGKALGAQLVNVTPTLLKAFPAIFGPIDGQLSAQRVVLDRRIHLTSANVAFMKGIATGLKSTGIPLAYVEQSTAKKSFVAQFKKLGVLTVGDIDKPAGQQRLERILRGELTTQEAVDAIKVTPASAVTADAGGSGGVTPWFILAVLLGGVAFVAAGPMRRRARSAA